MCGHSRLPAHVNGPMIARPKQTDGAAHCPAIDLVNSDNESVDRTMDCSPVPVRHMQGAEVICISDDDEDHQPQTNLRTDASRQLPSSFLSTAGRRRASHVKETVKAAAVQLPATEHHVTDGSAKDSPSKVAEHDASKAPLSDDQVGSARMY